MAKKKNTLSDEQIGALVERKIQDSVGFLGGTKLSKERENVIKFLNSELPARQNKGSSSYVSTDVYDAVESMKAQLLETFSGSQDIVKFSPRTQKDVEPARIATEYCSYVFYQQNDGFTINHDAICDGLMSRVGVVKVYWDGDTERQEETFENLDQDTVDGMTAQDDVENLDATLDPESGSYSGSLTRITKGGQVRIENIAPEEFGIDAQAKDLSAFHYHRTLKTKDELDRQGFDIKLLVDTNPDGEEVTPSSTETDTRFRPVDNGGSRRQNWTQEDNKPYAVYECYARLLLETHEKLYKVVLVAGKVLACDEIARSPFKVFVPLRVPHSFWGNNFAARVMPTQNARTVLMRGILDHTAITNNPRFTVLQGGLTNPREMLDNRLGGLVNVTRPDAINPLLQAPLNPFVYQTLETLKSVNEESTGISSLSQGLNKDAISSQNSQGMVNDLVALSQVRQKVVARKFAKFLADVFLEIYDLVIENEDRQSVIEVAGNWVEINPKTWLQRKNTTITFHLGQGAADAEAMKFTSLIAMGSQSPQLSRMIGETGLYNAAVTVLRLKNIKNTPDFITDPKKLPPPQPDPMMVANMQMEQKKVDAMTLTAQAAMHKAQAAEQMAQLQSQMDQMKFQFEQFLKMADNHRKDLESANKIDVSQRELTIVENAPDTDPAKAIASPNS